MRSTSNWRPRWALRSHAAATGWSLAAAASRAWGPSRARSDGFLALPGGLGTLDEIFEIWVSRTLGMHDKPLVVLDPDGVFAMMRAQVDDLILRGFARPAVRDAIQWATEVGEAFDLLESQQVRIVPTAGEVLESDP
jgi:hypothetical protein